jgi:hypothetical protein
MGTGLFLLVSSEQRRPSLEVCSTFLCRAWFRHSPAVPQRQDGLKFDSMAELITERIKRLRDEIAKTAETNRVYLERGIKYGSFAADHERRLQRLQEIPKR